MTTGRSRSRGVAFRGAVNPGSPGCRPTEEPWTTRRPVLGFPLPGQDETMLALNPIAHLTHPGERARPRADTTRPRFLARFLVPGTTNLFRIRWLQKTAAMKRSQKQLRERKSWLKPNATGRISSSASRQAASRAGEASPKRTSPRGAIKERLGESSR